MTEHASQEPHSSGSSHPSGRVAEVAAVFLKLGSSSFGGPIAHLGYFHRELVERRRWVDESQYGQLMALCQFLPGPASSQLGFVLGLLRAGWPGAIAAFVAFTLPSALLLFAFAAISGHIQEPWGSSLIHGLKLVAVAVVAQAVLVMARALTPDRPRVLLAAASAALVLIFGGAWIPFLVVVGAAVLGPLMCRQLAARPSGLSFALPYGRRGGAVLLFLALSLLIVAVWIAPGLSPLAQVVGAFYRCGALVFGGGHVVLPLLQDAVVSPGWISQDKFLAGYGAAQAVPGPLFSLAAFLGASLPAVQNTALGASLCLLAIFLPGLLLVASALPFWQTLGGGNLVSRVLAGVNAAVVGLLAAALYDPVWISAVHQIEDFVIAAIAFSLLVMARWPPLLVVALCAIASLVKTAVGSIWA